MQECCVFEKFGQTGIKKKKMQIDLTCSIRLCSILLCPVIVFGLLACLSLTRAASPRHALQHVLDLMAPASASDVRELVQTGRFERRIDESDDVFGGSTRASLRLHLRPHRLRFVEQCDGVRLADGVAVGHVVVGSSLCGFCAAETAMAGHLCAGQVAGVDGDGRARLAPVADVLSLVESLDVEFVHVPGNRSHAEAVREARKRGSDSLADAITVGRQFSVFDFNFDSDTQMAKEPLPLPELSELLAAKVECVDCFVHMTAGVELAFRLTSTGYGAPVVEFFQFVVAGELRSAGVIGASWPLSLDAEYSAALVDTPISQVPLVIPLGLLALTVRPSFTLDVEATASFGVPLNLTLGARQRMTLRSGVQIVRGQPVRRVQSCEQETSFESTFTGFPTLADVTLEATAGVRAALALDVGLTLAVLALLPHNPLLTVDISAQPFVTLNAAVDDRCNVLPVSYNITGGMLMGVSASPITLILGPLNATLTVGGVLPFEVEFAAIEPRAPPGCRVCQGCLVGPLTATLPRAAGPTVVAPPLPTSGSTTSDAFDVTVQGTSVAIGQPLVVSWRRGKAHANMEVAQVTFAVEVRRSANDTDLQATTTTTEQLDVIQRFDSTLSISSLRPFAIGAVTHARFVVIATHSDSVYGRSDWLPVMAGGSSGGAATRIYSGWAACSAECGSGSQNRTTTCVSGDGARVLASSACAAPGPLTRVCTSLASSCPFVRYSLLWPKAATLETNLTEWTRDFAYAVLNFEFSGGQSGRETAISLCPRGYYNHCSAKKPLGCMRKLTLPVSTSGTTRSAIEVSSRSDSLRIPNTFALLFENVGGGTNDWRLSPTFVVRMPRMTYFLGGETPALIGPVSIASISGTVVLPAPGYSTVAADIGQVRQVALTTKISFRMLSLRVSSSFLPIEIRDLRASKTPGTLVASCNPATLECVVCDANDTSCKGRAVLEDGFLETLPSLCELQRTADDVWATAVPAVVETTGTGAGINGSASGTFPDSSRAANNSPFLLSLLLLCKLMVQFW